MQSLFGYPIVALLSVLLTYAIVRHKQREEIARAYDDGYDDRESTIFPAIETDEEINYTRSFTSPVTASAFENDDTVQGYDHLFRPEEVPVSGTTYGYADYTPQSSESSSGYGRVPSAYISSADATSSEVQDHVDQLCYDMDNECEIYLAQLAGRVSALRTANAYDIYMGTGIGHDSTGPMSVIAREVTVTREVILQGASA